MKQKIAIIGAGAAGLVTAWRLRKLHDITIFEKDDHVGGHAYSYPMQKHCSIDMGAEYFSETMAPNFVELLGQLSIDTYVAPLTFAAIFDKEEYWSNYGYNGTLWNEIRKDCDRFHYEMNQIYYNNKLDKNISLGEYLREKNYSNKFIFQALVPLLTTFASYANNELEYSLNFCALLFAKNLISFFNPTYLRKVSGGIGKYINKLSEELEPSLVLGSRVHSIRREKDQVIIQNGDQTQNFDQVIFATHADQALSLISDSTAEEKEILGKFEYSHIKSILHTDSSILSSQLSNNPPYCEYKGNTKHLAGSLTRNNNEILKYYDQKFNNASIASDKILVTYNPKDRIDPNKILVEKSWKIPKLLPSNIENKRMIRKIQGIRRTWYCGTDTSFTGHEGSITSALVMAQIFGDEYPYQENKLALEHCKITSTLMGLAETYLNIY